MLSDYSNVIKWGEGFNIAINDQLLILTRTSLGKFTNNGGWSGDASARTAEQAIGAIKLQT